MKNTILLVFIAFLFVACGESKKTNEDNNTTFDENQKRFLYSEFSNNYLFKHGFKNLYPNESDFLEFAKQFDKPNDVIGQTAYRVSNKRDRWSYATSIKEDFAWQDNRAKGFGCSWRANKLKYIQFNSPCEKHFKRGDKMLALNNISMLNNDEASKIYEQAQNNTTKQSLFTIQRGEEILGVSIKPMEYNSKQTKAKIIGENGLLIYNSFTTKSLEELQSAFLQFQKHKIKNLIIDLRFNGGGVLQIASFLLDSLLPGHEGEVQMIYNFVRDNKTEVIKFWKSSYALNLNKIVFLVSKDTASASESLINALKAYKGDDIILIGSNTHGKPVGMESARYRGLIYYLINIYISNKDGITAYWDGLEPDGVGAFGYVGCKVKDDFAYPRDDIRDNLLSEALYFIKHGHCR